MSRKILILFLLFISPAFMCAHAQKWVAGIYISQSTLENTRQIAYLIRRAKETGINAFVIDFNIMSKRYAKNITLVHNSQIKYVARIVMFPHGGTDGQVRSQAYWEKRYGLVKQALGLGAKEIQLDYIRYNTSRAPSSQHAKDIYRVISWFKERLNKEGTPLQVDVFGISSFGEEKRIGQNPGLFAKTVDAINPMNYPSHYNNYRVHAKAPYDTVYNALTALRSQFADNSTVQVYNYIELSNYRYPMSMPQRHKYINAQIKATHDGGANGWYAWSPSNYYDPLFTVLKDSGQTKSLPVLSYSQ